MEQAEKICDSVCIIARGRKAIEGNLERIKREAAAEGMIALAFASDAEQERAKDGVLRAAFIENCKTYKEGLEVQLVKGHEPGQLLAALVEAGVSLRRFEHKQPSLHQIFVDRVGEQADTKVAERSVASNE